MSNTQKQSSGKGSVNNQAGHDLIINYNSLTEEKDFGIIDEIFNSVIANLEQSDERQDQEQIETEEKIKLNFQNENDQELVREYFRMALKKVVLIQNRIQLEDSEIQNDLHSHVLGKYRVFKNSGLDNISIMEALFEDFILPGKRDNPQYTHIAKAFVLFFFEDCTIFEKTLPKK